MGGVHPVNFSESTPDERERLVATNYEQDLTSRSSYSNVENGEVKTKRTACHHLIFLVFIACLLFIQVILFYNEIDFNDAVAYRSMSYFATITLSMSGTITAEKAGSDLGGTVVVALVTAFTGGTIRDIMLGSTPVYWLQDSLQIFIAVIGSVIIYITYSFFEDKGLEHDDSELLFWADAFSVAAISVEAAKRVDESPQVLELLAIPFSILVAAAGGCARDLLCARSRNTLRFYAERYASVAFVSSSVYLFLDVLSIQEEVCVFSGFCASVVFFYFVWKYNIQFPRLLSAVHAIGGEIVRRFSNADLAVEEDDNGIDKLDESVI